MRRPFASPPPHAELEKVRTQNTAVSEWPRLDSRLIIDSCREVGVACDSPKQKREKGDKSAPTMRARVVVFPIRGRAWVFSRSLELPAAAAITSASAAESAAPPPPPTLKVLWEKVSARGRKPQERAEAVVDFVADKVLDQLPQ